MNKILAAVGAIVVILVAAGAFWLMYVPPATAAILYIDEGNVEVDLGRGWIAATDEMELSQGNKVRTTDGTASVVLLEGEIVHLEPETEIAIQEVGPSSIKLSQAAGETWNKVTAISGVSKYEIETPTTVATVRGTEFYVKVGEEDEIVVEEGEVDAGFKKTSKRLAIGAKRKLTLNEKLDKVTEEIFDNDPRAEKFKQKYIRKLERMRQRELKKNRKIINLARKRYGVNDEQIQKYLDEADAGKQDIDKQYQQVPKLINKKLERAYKITKALQKAKRVQR